MESTSSSMQVKLYVLYFRQDDPKKNTALRLAKFGFVKVLSPRDRVPKGVLVLDPFSSEVLSPLDRDVVLSRGLLVVDCSWTKAIETFRRIKNLLRNCVRRRLPFLVSANPSHYGKPYMLTSAEAIAAALYIVGFKDLSEKIMSVFKWGPEFIRINYERLEQYSRGHIETEQEYFTFSKENIVRLLREFHDIPSRESSD